MPTFKRLPLKSKQRARSHAITVVHNINHRASQNEFFYLGVGGHSQFWLPFMTIQHACITHENDYVFITTEWMHSQLYGYVFVLLKS